jgi:hypothetical protein
MGPRINGIINAVDENILLFSEFQFGNINTLWIRNGDYFAPQIPIDFAAMLTAVENIF